MNEFIIWVGPIIKSEDLKLNRAASPAANLWQLNFIKGLIENNVFIFNYSYLPEPSWPKGKLWVSAHDTIKVVKGLEQRSISYLNIKGLREYWIAFAIICKIILKQNTFLSLFTYNPSRQNVLIGAILKKVKKIKWISIVADDLRKGTSDFDLYLSYKYFKTSKYFPKLFLDGGVNGNIVVKKARPTTAMDLVYSGSINKWTGIEQFVIDFGNLGLDTFNLHIYGKGDIDSLRDIVEQAGYNNIRIHGFVSDEILNNALEQAHIFVNPRNTDLPNSENNFPSKLLLYFSHEKPVISTISLGLSPEIKRVLHEFTDQESLKAQLFDLGNDSVYENSVDKIRSYKINNSWKKKVEKLLSEINE